MIFFAHWDTALVLTAVLAPVCLILFGVILVQWQRINELKHDHQSALTKISEMERVMSDRAHETARCIAENRAKHDEEINRKQGEIDGLHSKNAKLRADVKFLEDAADANRSGLCGSS